MMSHLTVLAPTTLLGVAVAANCASASWATGIAIEINEIRIEQSGTDVDEYVELRGTPNGSVDGLFYIVIGDSDSFPPSQNGSIESVTALTGSFDANGYFVLAKDTFTLGTADQVAALNFEGNDNVTHLLVSDFTGSLNDDLDTNDDGTLDVTPWDDLLDCIALLKNATPDGSSDEFFYCDESIGPDGGFVPGHVYRCEDTRALRIGDFSVGVDDTPGAPNANCGGGGGGGGDAIISEYRTDQPSTDNDEYFELAGEPGTSLDGMWFISLGDGSGGSGVVETAIDLSGYTIGSSGFFVVAEDTFSLGTADALDNVNFENSDNLTLLLVRDFTAGSGDDLDDGDDGVIDEPAPWSEIIDSIAVVESFTSGELIYSDNTVGPDGTFPPAHGYRCSPDGVWSIGEFDPTEGTDTPGAENLACPVVQCGGTDPRNCFEARAEPGCSDTSCCDLVNAVDSSCGSEQWDASCVEIAQQVCLSQEPAPAVSLSEIRMKQAGPDDDEYFELIGPANTSLDGVSLVVIGGVAEDLDGVIETAVNLSGYSTNSSGFFVAAEETFSLGPADALLDLNFTDAYNKTILLVYNFTGTVNGDLDGNNDCTLDSTPWDSSIDGVNWLSGQDSNCTYSTTAVGPDGDFSPAHGYICDAANGTWGLGTFAADDENAADTPGAANPQDCDTTDCEEAISRGLDAVASDLLQTYAPDCCANWDASCDEFLQRNLTFDAAAPASVAVVEMRIDQIGDDNDEYIELATAPGQSMDGYSVIIIGDGAGGSGQVETRIPLIDTSADANGLVLIADSFNYTLGTPTYDFNFNIENSDNITCFVVYGFSGDELEPDVDTDDDGTLDSAPWVEITSCIALMESDPAKDLEAEQVYCETTIGPDGTFVPGHVFFDCKADAWQMGIFDPVGESDTPGELNNGCVPGDGGGDDCPGDLNGDGQVDGADLSALLGGWGGGGVSDINGDGNTDGADLSTLLGAWGEC